MCARTHLYYLFSAIECANQNHANTTLTAVGATVEIVGKHFVCMQRVTEQLATRLQLCEGEFANNNPNTHQ
jgi:hypothetical protein